MYALFFEDNMDPIGFYETKNAAILVGKMVSSTKARPVVGIMNATDGNTTVCFKFMDGEQTYDGGCCPSRPITIPDPVLTHPSLA